MGSWSEKIFVSGSNGTSPYPTLIFPVQRLWLFPLISVTNGLLSLGGRKYGSTQHTANLYIFFDEPSMATIF